MSGITVTLREAFAFMAWRRNPSRDPRFRHQTAEQAMADAERLAKERPGSTYIVLQEIARVTAADSNSVPAAQASAAGGAGRRLSPLPSGSKGGA
ncbi:hypothetical protein HHL26_06560 [Sphingobium sp. TB-6]|uniref:hypothetical protein n=1 Tax=Sphingobium sp. TB-6 TaxID=2728850 RepID=UPI00146A6686|nr:hypothetical protein [Sphingobium sp. TB-6]NML88728.1 hypothetical protein [Sphingobium sp. TB-6]